MGRYFALVLPNYISQLAFDSDGLSFNDRVEFKQQDYNNIFVFGALLFFGEPKLS